MNTFDFFPHNVLCAVDRDLASALYRLGAEVHGPGCKLNYKGFSLLPNADSLSVLHTYQDKVGKGRGGDG